MRIEQISPTTFELQSDNGCQAIAGFAVNTMGHAGVYFLRHGAKITWDQAQALFHADECVKRAISNNPRK